MANTAAREQSAAGLRLRWKVWRERARLDAALAAGADPALDRALALRARQLTDPTSRRAMANAISNVLDAADEWLPASSRPPLQREAIAAARDRLMVVVEQLRQRAVIPAQGAALTSLLVWDSASPLYSPIAEASVLAWAQTVTESLVGG
ncbi:MAG TPA: hypothetical protein VGJ70_11890 [Solirubrobacteraceae bacterium]